VRCSLDGDKITPRDNSEPFEVTVGQTIYLNYHVQWQNARWKDKIVFNISPRDEGRGCPG